jgi:hypothetical protein
MTEEENLQVQEEEDDSDPEKPEKTAVDEVNKFFRVNSFTVLLTIDDSGKISEYKCNCDSDSRVEDVHMMHLMMNGEALEMGSESRDVEFCFHEYTAISYYFHQQFMELREEADVTINEL